MCVYERKFSLLYLFIYLKYILLLRTYLGLSTCLWHATSSVLSAYVRFLHDTNFYYYLSHDNDFKKKHTHTHTHTQLLQSTPITAVFDLYHLPSLDLSVHPT